eukprot:TRINITY_DN6534_c0_g1_i1.p1 TRINITY_DN6534_c0_g1~~TRINITY_DN6534_c0_g1_i1.p1  ORF type:complete len:250 (+),score=29.68 TRINITY_DN6534_c0_g1_i1:326-1075(+)
MKQFLKVRKDILKIKERNYNIKHLIFEKIQQFDHIQEFSKQSVANNRIPMVLSSKQFLLTKDEFVKNYKQINQNNIYEFSLRDIYAEFKTKGNCQEYLDQVKQALSNVLVNGETFLINLDETEQIYEEIYDPDLKQFYSPTHFPSQIWFLSQLKLPEVYEQILAGTANKSITKINPNFQVIVWSKFRIDQNIEMNRVLNKFERRFSSFIPTQKIDLALLCLQEKQQQRPSIEKLEVESQKEQSPGKKKN